MFSLQPDGPKNKSNNEDIEKRIEEDDG